MITVSDNNHVHLFGINRDGYRLIDKLTSVSDAGFSCDWDSTSTQFAVATQDGHLCVWDIRNQNTMLARLDSCQRGQKGACRSVKFSRSSWTDLLAFTEHTNKVHIVDTRGAFDQEQVLSINKTLGHDCHLTGIAFAPDSDALFVSTEEGVLEYPVNLVERRAVCIAEYKDYL